MFLLQHRNTENPCKFDVDHIIPVSLGGPTCLSNLDLLCVTCHRAKSGRERSRVCVTPSARTSTDRWESPNISPKEIPRMVASVERVLHITAYGILGGDYTLEIKPDDEKKRKRKQNRKHEHKRKEESSVVVHALLKLVKKIGYVGFKDYTTEICLKEAWARIDVETSVGVVQELVGGTQRNKTLAGVLKPWLLRYVGLKLQVRQSGKVNKRSVYKMKPCPQSRVVETIGVGAEASAMITGLSDRPRLTLGTPRGALGSSQLGGTCLSSFL